MPDVLFAIDTNNAAAGTQISVKLTAQSTLTASNDEAPRDTGTIINAVGAGVRFTSPADTNLPPVKMVENLPSVVAAPGQILNYSIVFRNNGAVTAKQTRVLDNLPDELEYMSGTLRLDNRSVTDVADADEGAANNRQIELLINEIAPGAVTNIQFQARLTGAGSTGVGVVNTASVAAANASAIGTSDAVAVVNPTGTVYAGNSGGAVRISGARIAVATDENGTPLNLDADAGFAPNASNVNPFSTDSNGNFAFALSNNQTGTAASPARYIVTVTAPNFRSRMLEINVQPSGANGFFNVDIRALDGQAIAVADGFALTSATVELANLAALVFNIPMFETSNLEIGKNADRQTAEIGDVVSYKISVKNATASPMSDTIVRDRLPEGFVYAAGTAEIQNG